MSMSMSIWFRSCGERVQLETADEEANPKKVHLLCFLSAFNQIDRNWLHHQWMNAFRRLQLLIDHVMFTSISFRIFCVHKHSRFTRSNPCGHASWRREEEKYNLRNTIWFVRCIHWILFYYFYSERMSPYDHIHSRIRINWMDAKQKKIIFYYWFNSFGVIFIWASRFPCVSIALTSTVELGLLCSTDSAKAFNYRTN